MESPGSSWQLPGARFYFVLVLMIVSASWFVRVYGLDRQGLECEELYTIPAATGHQYVYLSSERARGEASFPKTMREYQALLAPHAERGLGDVTGVLRRNVHLPLYFYLMHYWVQLGGTSERALRLPSAVCGTLAVLILFLVGKELFNPFVGAVGALLLGLMPEQIHFSQQARMYTLLVLLAVSSTYAILLARKYSSSAWPYLVYALVSVAGLYTHYEYLFFFAAQVAFVWLGTSLGRENRRRWLLSQASVAAAFAPWLLVGMAQQKTSEEVIAWARGSLTAAAVAGEIATKLTRLIAVPEVRGGWLSVVAACALFALGAFGLRRDRPVLWLLGSWIAFPLAGVLAMDVWLGTRAIGVMRYWMIITPALYLLMALGVQRIGKTAWRAGAVGAIAVLLCVAAFQTASGQLRRKPDRHEALARFVDQEAAGNGPQTIITEGVNSIPLALAYYGRQENRILRYKWLADELRAQSLNNLIGDTADVWVLVSGESRAVRLLEENEFRRSGKPLLFGHVLAYRLSKRPEYSRRSSAL